MLRHFNVICCYNIKNCIEHYLKNNGIFYKNFSYDCIENYIFVESSELTDQHIFEIKKFECYLLCETGSKKLAKVSQTDLDEINLKFSDNVVGKIARLLKGKLKGCVGVITSYNESDDTLTFETHLFTHRLIVLSGVPIKSFEFLC